MESTELNITKRTRYPAEFKAKVALEAIRGDQTITALAISYGLHPNMVANWKRQVVENMAIVFARKSERGRLAAGHH